MEDEQGNGGFVRQRRNLMLISLVLLFSEVAELRVSKLSAFGNELLIEQPHAVNVALWVGGVYWLLRFYQYSRPIFRNAIRNELMSYVQSRGRELALRKLLATHPELLVPFPDLPDVTPEVTIKTFTHHGLTMDYSMELELKVEKAASQRDRHVGQQFGPERVTVTRDELGWTMVKAWLHTGLHTTQITELILPYVLFALPVLYAVYSTLRGVL